MRYQDCAEEAADDGPEARASDALPMAEANINPMTGLASDYLNHFNEAIMLLEMLPVDPEFRDDFLRWRPKSYREHFAASPFESRDAAIAAYDHADPQARARLDALTGTMTAMLEATRAALRSDLPPAVAGTLAGEAAAALKPLVARAGAVINGVSHGRGEEAPQESVDDLMKA